jgi:hypothetical protein
MPLGFKDFKFWLARVLLSEIQQRFAARRIRIHSESCDEKTWPEGPHEVGPRMVVSLIKVYVIHRG